VSENESSQKILVYLVTTGQEFLIPPGWHFSAWVGTTSETIASYTHEYAHVLVERDNG
jgi:hypothetical protein